MSSLTLEITRSQHGSPAGDNWLQGYERADTDWTKPSDYYYRWSGGKNGKVTRDGEGNVNGYEFDTDRNNNKPWDIIAKGSVLIREVIFCDKDLSWPNIPDLRTLGTQTNTGDPMFTTYPKDGSWSFISADTDQDAPDTYQHHVWVWAQMDKDSPIIRCDPMVHNDGGN